MGYYRPKDVEFRQERKLKQVGKSYEEYLKESVSRGQTPKYFLKKINWNERKTDNPV